ncbi:MAG: DUF1624 domain-containing protein [Ignavibacteria bacterium]|nr:DUF1624 domain-containing protein [Ignavibacteria bacterium]
MNDALLQLFLAIDILQLIGICLFILLIIESIARRFNINNTEVLVLTALSFTVLNPIVSMISWESFFPLLISSWISTKTGSLFPLFPWGAYLLLGSAIGILLAKTRIARESFEA